MKLISTLNQLELQVFMQDQKDKKILGLDDEEFEQRKLLKRAMMKSVHFLDVK